VRRDAGVAQLFEAPLLEVVTDAALAEELERDRERPAENATGAVMI
jgi:hypothetical protein